MRKVYVRFFAVVLSATMMLNVLPGCSNKNEAGYEKAEGEEENEEYDNPDAAAEFQYRRNIDPATGRVPEGKMWQAVLETEALKNINPSTTASSAALTPLTWLERGSNSDVVGPSNGNQRPGNGVTSGRMRAVWADLADATRKTVWVGGVDGGIWKTDDVTATTPNWTLVNDFFSNLAVTGICQDPTNTNIMYFCTGEAFFNSGAVNGNGVFKSIDHGLTFNQLPNTSGLTRCSKILCDAAGNLYVSTIGIGIAVGLQRSTDGGNSFVSINPFTTTSRIVDFEISSTGAMHVSAGLFSAAGIGGYRYTKNPAASTPVWLTPTTPFPFPSGGSSRTELACVGNTVYASLGQANEKIEKIAKSTDGGDNWITTDLTPTNISDLQTGQGWYSQGLMADPSDPNTVIVGNLRLLKSTDGGLTFNKISEWVGTNGQYVHADIHNITWVDNGNKLLVGTDGGLFYSSDKGTTFSDKNTGLRLKQFNGVAVHPTLTNNFLCGSQDNGTHQFNNPGLSSSIEVFGGDGSITTIDQDEPQFQTTSTPFANFKRSINGGTNWLSNGNGSTKGLFVNPYDLDNVANKIYSSSNAGQYLRWEDPHTGFTFTDVTIPEFDDTAKVSSVTNSTLTANREYFGLNTGKIVRIDNADQAVPVATIITPTAMPVNTYVTCVAEGNGNVQSLLATVGNYNTNNVYSTIDGGTTWASCDGNLPNMPVYWAIYHPDANTKAYIATETGIWSTDLLNGSATVWSPESTFPTVKTTMLKYRASDRLLAAATYGRGLWTAAIPSSCQSVGITTQPMPQTVCVGANATFTVTATGFAPLNYQWQVSTNGAAGPFTNIGTNSSTLTLTGVTAAMNNNLYRVVITNSCPSTIMSVNVLLTVQSTPVPTAPSPITYCQNAIANPLTATGTNLLWYGTNATGGTGSNTAPTPSTAVVGSTTFYVSQTGACGESPRAAIVVNVTAGPSAPGVTSPVNYCQGATSTALTATGTGLLWYSAATGGTGSATAPVPNTSTIGSIIYYVSQNTGGCESPRASITVNVTAAPAAPVVTTPITYCQNSAASALTAMGTNLLWYGTNASGGVGSTTAPIPSTATLGNTIYYVSQSTGACESPRAAITVSIVASTPAPTAATPITYCQGAMATALTATGANLLWYGTNATGGTGSSTAPTPSTTTVGSTTFYVSQTTSCGEGPRLAIVVNIVATPLMPIAASPLSYCQGSTAPALSATGTNLLWYTMASGGTGSSTAPVPNTAVVGSTTYYVSQSTGTCESGRTAVVVNVSPSPAAPTVTTPVIYCQGATATALVASGTNLLWYGNNATGGTGSANAPTPSTVTPGTTTYYVSQTTAGCESPRAAIVVTVNALPTAPMVVSPIAYCQGAVATALSATGTGLLWFTSATGGVGVTMAPTPSTLVSGSITYYVSQTNNCGEGPRAAIIVNIAATPLAVTSLNATNITETSATLNWTGAAGNFYTIEYKISSATAWIIAATGITANSITVSNLTRGSTYNFRVFANCSAQGGGTVSSIATFSTSARNTSITNIKKGFGIKLTPNPFQSTGTLDYIVPGTGTVGITIVSANGKIVRTLFNLNQNPGQYTLNIANQLNSLSKGTYVIRLVQNGSGISLEFIKN